MALSALGTGFLPAIGRVLAAFPAKRPEPADARTTLCRFLDLVVTWNQRMDLTAARSTDELVDLMLADAALLASQGASAGERWLDVGTGAGAPGIALAILAPELALTLVEPRQKRVAFVRTALATLGRQDVRVERCRSEDLPSGSCEVAVARATLPPPEWLQEGTRLAAHSVWVLLARDEPPTLEGWSPDLDLSYVWPLTGANRRAVRYVRRP